MDPITDPSSPARFPPQRRGGFTLAEVLAVLVIMGIMVSIAGPRLNLSGYRTTAAMNAVGSHILAAQRAAVSGQQSVVVAFDAGFQQLRIHHDRDGDGRIDTGETVRVEALGEGVVFGQGGAPDSFVGSGPITFTKRQGSLPAVTFHRNGTASEEGGIYLTTRRAIDKGGEPGAGRLVVVDRATGRASWFSYNGSAWTREF